LLTIDLYSLTIAEYH